MKKKPSLDNKYKIIIQIVGFLFFSFLFVLAWVYYKERIICFDPSFFLYKMIEYKDYVIEFGRWGSVPPQLIPLWAIKNEFSLETVVKLYSVSFIFIFYLIFLIITVGLNNYKAGAALLLFLCLGFRHTFYYSTAELYQGMALAIIVWALVIPEKEYSSAGKKWLAIIISSLLIYVLSYYHQNALFAVLFILITEIIEKRNFKDIALVSTLLFGIIWFFIRVFMLSNTNYEKEKIIDLKMFLERMPMAFDLPGTLYYKQFFMDNLFTFSISLGLVLCILIYKKKYLLLLFSVLYFTGYFLLVVITFHRGESPIVLEHYFTVFSFFTGGMLMVLLYKKFNMQMTLLIVVLLLIINLREVYHSHYTLTKRVEYMERLISYGRTFTKSKFLLHNHNFPWQYAWVKWTLPFETAILSSLDSPDSTVTFFVGDNLDKYDPLVDKENIFLGAEWDILRFNSKNANKSFFRFPSSGYEKLSSMQIDSTFDEADFDKENIKLIPEKEVHCTYPDSFIVAIVKIINESGKIFSSVPDYPKGVYLSYHIFDKNDNLLIWDGIRTIPEVDIVTDYTQGLFVKVPPEKGRYIVEVDFVSEGIRWWEVNSRFNLIVD